MTCSAVTCSTTRLEPWDFAFGLIAIREKVARLGLACPLGRAPHAAWSACNDRAWPWRRQCARSRYASCHGIVGSWIQRAAGAARWWGWRQRECSRLTSSCVLLYSCIARAATTAWAAVTAGAAHPASAQRRCWTRTVGSRAQPGTRWYMSRPTSLSGSVEWGPCCHPCSVSLSLSRAR